MTPLVILNLFLGAACLACVLAVCVAAYLDVRERRGWRALVPPCWPPPGVDPRDAYADSESTDGALRETSTPVGGDA